MKLHLVVQGQVSFLMAFQFQTKEELLGKYEVLLLTVGSFKVQLVKTLILFYVIVLDFFFSFSATNIQESGVVNVKQVHYKCSKTQS